MAPVAKFGTFGASKEDCHLGYSWVLFSASPMAAHDVRGRMVARQRTARGAGVGELALFSELKPGTQATPSHADDPDVWHEALVTWSFLGVDRAAAILIPDGDHFFELMDGACRGPLWVGVCDSEGACDNVLGGGFFRIRSRRRSARLARILDGGSFGADGRGSAGTDKPGEEAAGVGDLLAGWTATDESDSRFKTWRSVVLEGTQETFSDSVASVPATVFTACRKMLQKGVEPRRWFADWAKELASGG